MIYPSKKKGDFQYYAKLPESKTKPNSSPTVPGWMVYILFQPHQLIRIITVATWNAMVFDAGYIIANKMTWVLQKNRISIPPILINVDVEDCLRKVNIDPGNRYLIC